VLNKYLYRCTPTVCIVQHAQTYQYTYTSDPILVTYRFKYTYRYTGTLDSILVTGNLLSVVQIIHQIQYSLPVTYYR
jgi:hypothetical protein